MKKTVTRIIAIIISIVSVYSISIAVNAQYYSDIATTNPNLDYLNYVTDREYIDPVSTTQFSPSTNMKRGDVALMLYRYDGTTSSSTTNPFTDIPSSSKYAKAVTWAYNNNIINGISATLFAPNSPITREDLCTVMYRYATYCGSDTIYSIDNNALNGFTDASQIHSYAKTPMKWAVTHGLIAGTSPTTLSPLSNFIREYVAVLIRRYHLKIDKFKWGKDNYSFSNSSSVFTYGYYINYDHLVILDHYCTLYNTPSVFDYVLEMTTEDWGGSCAGIAMTTLLQLRGIVDYTGNFGGSTAKNLHDISATTNLTSAINYYHCLQSQFQTIYKSITSNSVTTLKDLIDTNGPTIIGYRWQVGSLSYGHAVLAYKYEDTVDGKTIFYVANPNNSLTYTTLTFDPVNGTCFDGSVYATRSRYYTMSRQYDLDDYYNDFDFNNLLDTVNNNAVEHQNEATFTITMSGNYTITNNEGEVLSVSGDTVTGDMKIISESSIDNGPETPAEIVIKVPDSTSFRFRSDRSGFNGIIKLSSGNQFSVIDGESISSVLFTGSMVNVNTDDCSSVGITSTTDATLRKMIGIKGISSGSVSWNRNEETVSISGIETINSATIYNRDRISTGKLIETIDAESKDGKITFDITNSDVRFVK